MLNEWKTPVKKLAAEISDTWRRLDPDRMEREIAELETITNAPDFWTQPGQADATFGRLKGLRNRHQGWQELISGIEDLDSLVDIALEENDESLEGEVQEAWRELEERYNSLANIVLMGGESDVLSAFLTIHSGAGGTEACDWAAMLYRMYSRWVEQNNFKPSLIDYQAAEGGIKSVTVQIDGDYVFGLLKGENGIHRLVRISPFDSNSRRHTSFASVYVSPVLDDSIVVDIAGEDIRVDTYRAGGAGGQHVNKTDSAVRITHLSTNIVVQCQNERSQHKNKDMAMKMLRSRVYEYYRVQQQKERQKNVAEKKEIGWGSQIRSYVFQPYTMVKDLRTRHETGNVQSVMDGAIDPFIQSYLRWAAEQFHAGV
ncbi:peptide chain release factor 2 [Candidatus Haliotispira prima]|uniref:Peptide chain release factor 2 n=1 Tax=Candidatus Haliotispira prima TaxID=3034016 RepID=A0ABY8MHQ9_9SPIO|nr:peptide chain release factor 2 [Candidatus Haliotispira prima]